MGTVSNVKGQIQVNLTWSELASFVKTYMKPELANQAVVIEGYDNDYGPYLFTVTTVAVVTGKPVLRNENGVDWTQDADLRRDPRGL